MEVIIVAMNERNRKRQRQVPSSLSAMTMRRNILGIVASLAAVAVSGQQVGVDICACTPATYNFTFDFTGTCPPIKIPNNEGIIGSSCLVGPFGNPDTTDFVPVFVNEIDIQELGQNLSPVFMEKVEGEFYQDDSFIFTSITNDVDSVISSQEIPRVLELSIVGFNAVGEALINVFLVTFTNDCDAYPVFQKGISAGWAVFTDLKRPLPEFCPNAGVAPTDGPTSRSSNPSRSPNSSPTDSPSAIPTITPGAPTVSPPAPTAGPTFSPTDETLPTPGPTFRPSATPTVTPAAPTAGPTFSPTDETSPTPGPAFRPPSTPTVTPAAPTAGPTFSPTEPPVTESPTDFDMSMPLFSADFQILEEAIHSEFGQLASGQRRRRWGRDKTAGKKAGNAKDRKKGDSKDGEKGDSKDGKKADSKDGKKSGKKIGGAFKGGKKGKADK